MGFPQNLVDLIMLCVSSTSFSMLVNGLISLLQKSTCEKSIEGFRVCRGAPYINYLLFVDDSLNFCKANSSSSNSLKDLLNCYPRVFGQSINTGKKNGV